jgi:hypothetical protein
MNILSHDQQIQVIAALIEGVSIRSVERMTGIHRNTIMRLGARVGQGCAELHDRSIVGLRVARLELDELWAFVGKKQRHLRRGDSPEKGDQYPRHRLLSHRQARYGHHARVYRGPAGARAWRPGNLDGWLSAVSASNPVGLRQQPPRRHQQNLQRRSPGQDSPRLAPLLASGRDRGVARSDAGRPGGDFYQLCGAEQPFDPHGLPTLHPANQRVQQAARQPSCGHRAYYNLCRVHETLRTTPAVQLGITDRVWSLGDLIDAALALARTRPVKAAETVVDSA